MNKDGSSGFGVAVFTNTEQPQLVLTISQYLGDHRSNNQAEYAALFASIQVAIQLQVVNLSLFSDSKLLVDQINGQSAVRDEILTSLWRSCKSLLDQEFPAGRWRLEYINRERNKVADKLSKDGSVRHLDCTQVRIKSGTWNRVANHLNCPCQLP